MEEICEQLAGIEKLQDGFDAVGFSQGGQILRAYIQRCNTPPVKNLITIGAQHQGVSNFPGCPEDIPLLDFSVDKVDLELVQVNFPHLELSQTPFRDCTWWQRMMKRRIYTDFVQNKSVQAQYFKDPLRMEEYLEKSIFLADMNNERPLKNETFAKNLSSLTNLVLFMFEDDVQVVPKESSVLSIGIPSILNGKVIALVVWILRWSQTDASSRAINVFGGLDRIENTR